MKSESVSLRKGGVHNSLGNDHGHDRIDVNNSDKVHTLSIDSKGDRLPLVNHASIESAKRTFTSTVELEAEIERDMRKYRMKYIFCQSFSVFCHSFRHRFPSEKSAYLALSLCLFERLAYYAAVGNILQPYLVVAYPSVTPAVQSLLFSIFMDMMAQLLFPLFGWIADAWVGRYTLLHFSMWFLWLGYGLMTLLFALDSQVSWNRYLLPLWMTIINIGSAGFQANAIPFGADQILFGSSNQISSFFYWYYWLRNIGAVCLFLSFSCKNHHAQWHGYVTFGLVSTASMSVALVLNGLMRNWFFIDNQKRNPIRNIIRIFLAAITVQRPKIRSAFSFSSLAAPSRMDLTKEVHGGKFDSEEVENAKTVGRMLVVLLSASGALIIVRGILNIIGVQVQGMEGGSLLVFSAVLLKHCTFDSNFTWILNVVVILVAIPLLNLCVVPYLREYRPNMLKKIAIGYLFVVLTSVCMLVIILAGEKYYIIETN